MHAEMVGANNEILVVDDDPDISQALTDFLEHEGYRVHVASTGAEALARATRHQYGAVILDLGLPDVDGITVLSRVQEHDPKLPVIILTAYTASEKTAAALSRGAFALLTKPYNREQLKATLRRAIGVKVLATRVETVETALLASEDRFRSVVQSASDAIVLADSVGRILFCNRAAERLFLYRQEEMLGHSLTLLMPERYREAHERGIERMRAGGEARVLGRTLELHGLKKDGSEVPIELSLGTWQAGDETCYCGILRDITERKQAEAAQAERLRLASFLAEIGTAVTNSRTVDGMLRASADAMVRHLQAAFARVWLLDADRQVLELRASAGLYTHLDGRHSRIRVGDMKIGQIAAARRPHVTNDLIHEPEVSDPEWAAQERMVAFAGYPLVVEDRVIGVVGVFARHELTEFAMKALASAVDGLALGVERKQTQEWLERLSRYHAMILDSAGEGIYGLDHDGRTTFVNHAAAQLLQWSPEELRGKPMHRLLHHSRADGSPYPAAACPIYAALRDGSVHAVDDEVFWRKDGTCFPVEYVSTPIREGGRVVGAVVVFKDITARKRVEQALRESEERFRQVTEHINEVFWMTDPDKKQMLYISRGYEEIWGRTCASLYAAPQSWMDAIHPEDRARVEKAAGMQADGGYTEEYRVIRPDGSIRWVRDRAFPIKDASGVVYRIAGIALDITTFKSPPDDQRGDTAAATLTSK